MPYVRIVAEHGFASEVIRGWTGDLFSHIGFRLDEGPDGGDWLDCRFSLDRAEDGVRIRPGNSLQDFRHVDFTFRGIEDAITYGRTLLGTHYDVSNILGMAFDPTLHDPSDLICSRFVQECSEHTAFPPLLNPAVRTWHVRPAHFVFSPNIEILDLWPADLQL